MQQRSETVWTALGVGIAIGFAVTIAIGAFADRGDSEVTAPTETKATQTTPSPAPLDDPDRRTAIVQAVERVAPAVVSITTESTAQDLFRLIGRQAPESSDGSGVIIDDRGVVLTNAHVVSRASRITATLADGRSGEATVLGIAPTLDLAVLLLADMDPLQSVEIGRSHDLMLGEPVIAIGNPFGLGHTVTTGVVSATRRPLATDDQVYQDFIQTDASINPGNSGGPLLNIHGKLVGITTSIRPDAQGIGFAIPVDRAVKVARDLVETGHVQIPWLGVTLEDVMLRKPSGQPQAVRIKRVAAGSSGVQAGLMAGDIIHRLGDRMVLSRADLNTQLSAYDAGASVELSVRGVDGERKVVIASSAVGPEDVERSLAQVVGGRFALQGTDAKGNVVLTGVRPGTALARIGLRPGDRIRAVDGRRIRSLDDFYAAIQRALNRHRPTALFDVRRGRAQGRIPVPI